MILPISSNNCFFDFQKNHRDTFEDEQDDAGGSLGVLIFAKAQPTPETLQLLVRGSGRDFRDIENKPADQQYIIFAILTDLHGAFIPGDFINFVLSGSFAQIIIVTRKTRLYDTVN